MTKPSRARAVALVLLAGVFLSTAGIGVRLADDAAALQIVFYRSLGMATFLLGLLFWRYRQTPARIVQIGGRSGVAAALCFAGASIAIIFALIHTSVANAMFIVSLAPFFTAVLGWLILSERVHLGTWIAMGVAAVGVLVMVEGGVSGDGLLGMAYALAMALCYAGFSVAIRAGRGGDMLPAICVSGFGLALVLIPFLDTFTLPARDLAICLGLGVFQVGLGGTLLTYGARGLPAAQVNFLAMAEVILSPLWVWLIINEQPSSATLLGGAIILCAISYQALQPAGETAPGVADP
ncbi:MAG: DMT family transporter [Pseudomonadota bacterium]